MYKFLKLFTQLFVICYLLASFIAWDLTWVARSNSELAKALFCLIVFSATIPVFAEIDDD
jgi:ABC-type proline/glycine betaine transport system permease subunit